MKNTSSTTSSIPWIDILRIIACFLVVMAHCCDPFVARFDSNRAEFLSGAYWGSLVRSAVPLFVMMSGVLLLPIKQDVATFYGKRLKKILIPLVVWSVLTPLFYYFYVSGGVESLSPNIAPENHTLSVALTKIYTFVFNFTYDTIPFWYLYMLVGLYLFMPIIGAWLVQASKKDIKVFLWIWGVTLVLPYVQMGAPSLGYAGNYGNMGLLGVCDWNPFGMFYYFSGFMGYIVLAYYLTKYPLDWSFKKTMWICMPIFAVGYLITNQGFILTQKYFPGSYANLEIVWYFTSINVFMMTFSVFVVMQKLKLKHSPLLSKIASLTFGVYLIHYFIVQVFYDQFYGNIDIPAYVMIPLLTTCVFAVSLVIVWILKKWSLTSKIV